MIPGFHVSSLLLHDEAAVVSELAALGYQCVAVRPRCGSLDPNDDRFPAQMMRLAERVHRHQMTLVIDSVGAFMTDPHRYRGPSLAGSDPTESAAAEAWIAKWIEIAAEFKSPLITFGSGIASCVAEPALRSDEATLNRLSERINRLIERAVQHGVRLALRPASREAVATVAQFERFSQWIDQPVRLYLAADIGEMLQEGEFPVADRLARNMTQLACVYLCERESDRTRDQLPENCEIDLRRITKSLRQSGYTGFAIARVDGHCENGTALARNALDWFQKNA